MAQREVRVAQVLLALVRLARPAQLLVAETTPRSARAPSPAGGGSGSSDSTSSTVAAAIRRAVASSVSITMPSRHGVVQDAIGPAAPSRPTMHTRHAPNGAWRSS